MRSIRVLAVLVLVSFAFARPASAESRQFAPGSLVIPMDLSYQDRGMFQAYGLLFQLLRQGVPVAWVIEPTKTWHAAPCNTAGDLCAWDCAIEGSGNKCTYPTASPDFFVGSTVFMSPTMTAGTAISNHGYRGGPFVIDAAHAAQAKTIITIWNTQAMWPANPWAQRTTGFQVVTVHETTAAFTGFVSRDLVAAPTIAVFSDGHEDIATDYLRAAGIKQSNGSEFPAARCNGNCGPGTANPDMLTVPSVAGDMGTCATPDMNHKNGALFTADGIPAYCQIMSMHWDVADRETVQCNGGNCPATQAQCTNQTITYHGHEVVAEVRKFLEYPVHFFAECQAVNAYENTVPNPAWPYLDDAGREGHFLTTVGTPPACPCTEPGFSCVNNVCIPTDVRERGAGFLIANSPNPVKILHPEVPYNQMDGAFATEGGSEPAYNLSTYLGTEYKNDREVTFVTASTGPGVSDVWMTGYSDGECDIAPPIGLQLHGPQNCGGKVSYLGGHAYSPNAPLTNNQGTRLFLNALFEADCVSSVGQPALSLTLTPTELRSTAVPAEGTFTAGFSNSALGPALDGAMSMQVGAGVEIVSAAGGTINGDTISWTIGSVGGSPGVAGDPPSFGSKPVQLRFAQFGTYTVNLSMTYRSGVSTLTATPVTATIVVAEGTASDGDAGGGDDGGGGGGGQPSGCCQSDGAASPSIALASLVLGVLSIVRRRRRRPR